MTITSFSAAGAMQTATHQVPHQLTTQNITLANYMTVKCVKTHATQTLKSC